jgi:hypothetical protein
MILRLLEPDSKDMPTKVSKVTRRFATIKPDAPPLDAAHLLRENSCIHIIML